MLVWHRRARLLVLARSRAQWHRPKQVCLSLQANNASRQQAIHATIDYGSLPSSKHPMASHLHLPRIVGQFSDNKPPNSLQNTERTTPANQHRSHHQTLYPSNVLNPHPPLSLLRPHLVSKQQSHPIRALKETTHLTTTTTPGSSSTAPANPPATS